MPNAQMHKCQMPNADAQTSNVKCCNAQMHKCRISKAIVETICQLSNAAMPNAQNAKFQRPYVQMPNTPMHKCTNAALPNAQMQLPNLVEQYVVCAVGVLALDRGRSVHFDGFQHDHNLCVVQHHCFASLCTTHKQHNTKQETKSTTLASAFGIWHVHLACAFGIIMCIWHLALALELGTYLLDKIMRAFSLVENRRLVTETSVTNATWVW